MLDLPIAALAYSGEASAAGHIAAGRLKVCWRIGNRPIPVCFSISPMAAYPRPATRPARLRALLDLIREPAPSAA